MIVFFFFFNVPVTKYLWVHTAVQIPGEDDREKRKRLPYISLARRNGTEQNEIHIHATQKKGVASSLCILG